MYALRQFSSQSFAAQEIPKPMADCPQTDAILCNITGMIFPSNHLRNDDQRSVRNKIYRNISGSSSLT